jgi:hypothetical protein
MLKRLFALVVALEVCQLTCESKGMQSLMSHAAEGHAAHHQMSAGHAACHEHGEAPQQLSPLNGLCDHGTEATPSLVAARNSVTSVSLLAAVPSIGSIELVPTRGVILVRVSALIDRLEVPLAIPLRV